MKSNAALQNSFWRYGERFVSSKICQRSSARHDVASKGRRGAPIRFVSMLGLGGVIFTSKVVCNSSEPSQLSPYKQFLMQMIPECVTYGGTALYSCNGLGICVNFVDSGAVYMYCHQISRNRWAANAVSCNTSITVRFNNINATSVTCIHFK